MVAAEAEVEPRLIEPAGEWGKPPGRFGIAGIAGASACRLLTTPDAWRAAAGDGGRCAKGLFPDD